MGLSLSSLFPLSLSLSPPLSSVYLLGSWGGLLLLSPSDGESGCRAVLNLEECRIKKMVIWCR